MIIFREQLQSNKYLIKRKVDKCNKFIFILFPNNNISSSFKKLHKYYFLENASSNFRLKAFLKCFHRNGKKLRALVFLFNLLLVIKFSFKCKNALFFLNVVISVLEPFFELKNVKRRRRTFLSPIVISLKKRARLASRFFYASIEELKHKFHRVSRIAIAAREIKLILRKRKCGSIKRFRQYNYSIRRYRFFIIRRFKHGKYFPKEYKI